MKVKDIQPDTNYYQIIAYYDNPEDWYVPHYTFKITEMMVDYFDNNVGYFIYQTNTGEGRYPFDSLNEEIKFYNGDSLYETMDEALSHLETLKEKHMKEIQKYKLKKIKNLKEELVILEKQYYNS